MELALDFVGFEEAAEAMEVLPGQLGQHVQGDGMLAMARVVAADAKTRVPARTGRLRESIKARKQGSYVHTSRGRRRIAGSAARVVAGGPGAHQAYIIEFGRAPGPGYPGMAPRPYLEPALFGTKSEQLSAAGAAMRRSFARLATQITSGRATKRTLRLLAEDT
ncbi:HK97 gp10 family phage protein [Candidatus Palauibacter sp.]|uniref:HK97 gp10 family phage protein n=1 Tax=Candidatus Palauibacter sp. TaxID=3101350 RepID=UPI003CC571C0